MGGRGAEGDAAISHLLEQMLARCLQRGALPAPRWAGPSGALPRPERPGAQNQSGDNSAASGTKTKTRHIPAPLWD